jgi:ATP-binding cassette subfamily C protein CydC
VSSQCRRVPPSRRLVLAVGLLVGGIVVPALAAGLGRRTGTLEVVPRAVSSRPSSSRPSAAHGARGLRRRGQPTPPAPRGRSHACPLRYRAALADGAGDGLRLLVTGCTVAGVLAVAVSGKHRGASSTAS